MSQDSYDDAFEDSDIDSPRHAPSPPSSVPAFRPTSASNSSRPRASRPSDTQAYGARRRSGSRDRDAEYYDSVDDYSEALASSRLKADGDPNNDLRSALAALSASNVSKLRPADVANLKAVSGEAWQKKLEQLVSTVKGEKYSRAPAHVTSLLIDSTSASALGGYESVNHRDPSSLGESGGSYFSAHPPPFVSDAKKRQAQEVEDSKKLFHIARTVDGAVYGAKAYSHPKGGHKPEQRDKVLDKFAADAEEMKANLTALKKKSAELKSDVGTIRREADLLDAHLQAQNHALDEAALRKGFLRVGSVADKPRYEKMATGGAGGGSGAKDVAGSKKLNLEEQYLTLQVQHKSLRAEKHRLMKAYDELQDEMGNESSVLSAGWEREMEMERDKKSKLLAEMHELQVQMHVEKSRHEEEAKQQDARIQQLRHEAGVIQAQLDIQRKTLTNATLKHQEVNDRHTAIQAKIHAIKKRLARHTNQH